MRAREVILSVFSTSLERVLSSGTSKDPKTRLQELLQAAKRPLPSYEVLHVSGSQHEQEFLVRCNLADTGESTQGEGSSRRRAEQQAAQRMLDRLGVVAGP